MTEDQEIRAKALECAILYNGPVNTGDRVDINKNINALETIKDYAEKMEKYIRNNTF